MRYFDVNIINLQMLRRLTHLGSCKMRHSDWSGATRPSVSRPAAVTE